MINTFEKNDFIRIREVKPKDNYVIYVEFDDGKKVLYDVKNDIKNIYAFEDLKNIAGLFKHVKIDSSRTSVFWNDIIDLSSDWIYEAGTKIN